MLCRGWHITGDYKSDNAREKEVDPKGPATNDPRVHRDGTGRLHKTRGGQHYDHHRPSMHVAAGEDGSDLGRRRPDLPGRRRRDDDGGEIILFSNPGY